MVQCSQGGACGTSSGALLSMLAVVSVGKEGAHHLTQLFLLCACVCVCVPTNLPIEVLQELLTVGVADSGDALTLGRGGAGQHISLASSMSDITRSAA